MSEVEKSGVPTVSLITTPYETNWKASGSVVGSTDLPHVVTATDTLTMKSTETVHALVDGVMEQILARLTDQTTATPGATGTVSLARLLLRQDVGARLVFEGADPLQAWEEMNRQFLEYQWGDGFPLVAPTEDAVAAMLKGTRRSPSDVIANMEPGYGIATVEKIAINAVMAGCKPGYLPVMIAAVEAMNDRLFSLRHVSMSSSPYAPFLVVNGPYGRNIRVNSGRGCFGPGAPSAVNTAIGRAIRLIMMNVGGAWLGVMDQDSHGHPNKYSMCIAEREEESPWQALHTERGYGADESTVTVFAAHSSVAYTDTRNSQAVSLLESLARTVCNPGAGPAALWTLRPTAPHSDDEFGRDPDIADQHICIVFSVDHANILRRENWSKDAVKQFLHERVKAPFRHTNAYYASGPNRIRPDMRWLYDNPDQEIPLYLRPDSYQLVVAGFGSGDTQVIFSGKHSITRKIEV